MTLSLPDVCYLEQALQEEMFISRTRAERSFWNWLQNAQEHGQRAPLFLLKGPPGSGKSWLFQRLHREIPGRYPHLAARYLPWDRSSFSSPEQTAQWLAQSFSFPLPPDLSDLSPREIVFHILQQIFSTISNNGLVLFIDGLDRLSFETVQNIERQWLSEFLTYNKRPVWLALVHYGPISAPRLRLQGQEVVSLGALEGQVPDPWQHVYRDYQLLYQRILRLQPDDTPYYDFRYPLLNAYWQTKLQVRRDEDPRLMWRLGLACLFTRREATRLWADTLRLADSDEEWLVSSAGALLIQMFQEPGLWQKNAHRRFYNIESVPVEQRGNLQPLLDAGILTTEPHFYVMDASLWGFFYDTLKILTEGL